MSLNPILLLIKIYQILISPFLGTRCRFVPSCSEYAKDAVSEYGVFKGSKLTIKRLCKCHPWGKDEIQEDYVPIREE